MQVIFRESLQRIVLSAHAYFRGFGSLVFEIDSGSLTRIRILSLGTVHGGYGLGDPDP